MCINDEGASRAQNRAGEVHPRPQGEATRSFGSRDNTQPLLSPTATGTDLFHHTGIHRGGPQQHMVHGLLQRHNVPCKGILPHTLAVLEDFPRYDYWLPKRSAQPPAAPLSHRNPEYSSRRKREANSSARKKGESPAGRGKEERGDRYPSKAQRSHQPAPQQQSNKEAPKG